jgi:uncharacterized cupin superfamily protein
VLYGKQSGPLEVGIERWPAGNHFLECVNDRLCYFVRGRGSFRNYSGETIEVEPGMAAHLKSGWEGELEIIEALDASYMECPGSPGPVLVLRDAARATPLKDWGMVATMVEGSSHTAGILLSRDADGRAESGLWTCTPGMWRCEVRRDEFCHFLDGDCCYTHESGEKIEIAPDTLALFPAGWRGLCQVRKTARKIYMIA